MERNKFEIQASPEKYLEEVVAKVINEKWDVVNPILEHWWAKKIDDAQFKEALFSNMKMEIIKAITGETSKEAWNKVESEYGFNLIIDLVSKKGDEMLSNWRADKKIA